MNAGLTTQDALKALARQVIAARPDLQAQVIDILELALCEIAEGGSEENEYELAARDFDALLRGARP